MISGGSKGLGAALARRFAAEGAALSICARTAGAMDPLVDEIRKAGGVCFGFRCDVTCEEDVEGWLRATVEQLDRVDVLVNNASILGPRVPIVRYPPDAWREVLEVNLTGAYLFARTCIPTLTETRGSMIHVSSGVGDHGRPNWGAYCVAKNGLEALSEMLAGELAEAGVRSNAVDPGAMRTEMRAEAYPEEDPGSVPPPLDITDVFVYLASDRSRDVTGKRFRAREFSVPSAAGEGAEAETR
jgi:NAD(P)-dependent dehydrogenase (short-subunit alcohol dehydrogenase family)